MFDRERFTRGSLPIWVQNEHHARWRWASKFVVGKRVVDCACGAGEGSAMFAREGAAQVLAFDISKDAVEITRRLCSELPTVTVRQANGLNLPLSDASIDVFVSLETIEHIEDDQGFLAEVARVLVPGGTFVCSTPNRAVTMPGKTLMDRPWNPFHLREYNQQEFLSILSERFPKVRLYGQNIYPLWRTNLFEWIGRSLPGHMGGRINSALKIPRIFYDREQHHGVCELPQSGGVEYYVALCTN